MANTTTRDGDFIHVLFDGATDWDVTTEFKKTEPEVAMSGLCVKTITFIPKATDNAIIIRNSKTANTTSPILLKELASSKYGIAQHLFDGKAIFPSIDSTEVTATVEMIIQL